MFKKKNIFALLLIVLLLGLALYCFYFLNSEEDSGKEEKEEEKDEIVELLDNLKQETALAFSEIEEVEFEWRYEVSRETQKVQIQGQGFTIKQVSAEKSAQVRQFFKDNGLELDLYNVADGITGGLEGYKKEQLVCLVSSLVSNFESESSEAPADMSQLDLEVECGWAKQLIERIVSTEQAIAEILAQEYQTKTSAFEVLIEQETEDYVQGEVRSQFGPGFIFFAARVDDKWQIVFKGQDAPSCEELEEYGFPEKMRQGCSYWYRIETETGKTFSLILDANPSTGYSWSANFNQDYLELVSRDYHGSENEELVGMGGYEIFEFKAIEPGQVEISFFYARPWESVQPLEKKVYDITIK